MQGNFLNIIKGIYEKPTTNILNVEKLNASSVRSGTKQGYLLSVIFMAKLYVCLGYLSLNLLIVKQKSKNNDKK